MYNFFQDAKISIDYDFDDIILQNDFKPDIEKKYIFVSPYSKNQNSNYATNPYKQQNEYVQLSNSVLFNDNNDEDDDCIDEIKVEKFEKELLKNSLITKTIFHPNGKFETSLPTGEIYANEFEDNSYAPYYLEELNSGFGNINGFKIEYFDNSTKTIKKWLAVFDTNKQEYRLHNLEDDRQIDNTYSGNQKDFKSLVKNIIENSIDNELKSAIFYQ